MHHTITPLDPSLRDNEVVSHRVDRAEPRVLNFSKLRDEPTRENIMLTSLALSLRGMVEQGSIPQSEADRQLDDYRQRLWNNPFASDLQVFMSASKPAGYSEAREGGARFSDTGKEAAVAGSIVSGLFHMIPAHCLVSADAFSDVRWRIVYSAALALRDDPSSVCCAESVSDYIAMHDLDIEMQEAIDSTNTVSWRKWSELADTSMAYGDSTRPLEYCLGEIDYLFRKRRASQFGARLASGELELKDARVEFDELLHASNGNFDFVRADERKFDACKLHEKPEPTILLDNKVMCTSGNISVIYAKPKAGKSDVVSAIIASAISDPLLSLDNDFLGFSTRRNDRNHALIHIDTEQSRFDHEQIVLRALRRAQKDQLPAWVRTYCVTDFAHAERRAFLVAEIERARRECGHGLFAVIVDGVGDFIPDINNLEQSNEFAHELHALAIRHETILLLVLHENPNESTQKTRGHLGSQLERKAESNIRIVKDPDGVGSIYTERSRHAHITKTNAHCFKFDESLDMHVTIEVERKGRDKDESDLVEQIFNCDAARAQAGALKWVEVLNRLVELGLYKKRDSARRRFKKLLDDGWISKQGDEHYFASQPTIPS